METLARMYRYPIRAAATLLGAAVGSSSLAPCRGAKYVVLRFKSTDASDVLAAAGFNVGNLNLLFNGAGQGAIYATRGPVTGFAMNGAGGVSFMILPVDPNGRIMHDYIQATFAAAGATPANDITGFQVDAEVFYDDGFDQTGGQVLSMV